MQYTLLDLTQNILSSMDSDEINSISDTTESLQVVQIIKTVYNDIISRGGSGIHKTLFTLTASGDITKPVLMTKPTNIISIDWLRYNRIMSTETDPGWGDLTYMLPENFISYTQQYSLDDTGVDSFTHTVNGFNLIFHYKNDTGPNYYTSFDDNVIIFDGYDSSVDSTLQAAKTLGYGSRDVTFTETDGFIPALQPDQFSLLLNEAKSLAWVELKQTPHVKAETTARKNWTHLAKTRQHITTGRFNDNAHSRQNGPYFGRK